jgi:hypothetical protein
LGRLSARDEALALLLAAGTSQVDAARSAGVTPRTVRRKIKGDGVFRDRVADLRRELLATAVGRFLGLLEAAAAALREVLEDPEESGAARVSAARAVVDAAYKGYSELDFDARLAELEAAAARRQTVEGR